MATTRKALREKLGEEITDAQISEILNIIHSEVDTVRDERDELKKQLETMTKERDDAAAGKEKAEKDLTDYQEKQATKEARTAKENAYKALLEAAGIPDKRHAAVLRLTDFDGVELNKDGTIKGAEKLTERLKTEWAEFIPVTNTQGVNVENPPKGGTKTMSRDEIMAITDRDERRAAIAANPAAFGR